MRIFVDNNLPYSLAVLFRKSNLDAVHVVEAGLANVDDDVLRERFAKEEIVFLTRDSDFWADRPSPWCVIWLALHNPRLVDIKGPIAQRLIDLVPSLHPGQRVLVAADQIRVFV